MSGGGLGARLIGGQGLLCGSYDRYPAVVQGGFRGLLGPGSGAHGSRGLWGRKPSDSEGLFEAMDVTKPYHFVGFEAMDVTKPYVFTGFEAVDVTKRGFEAMKVTKPYDFLGFRVRPQE